MITCKTCGNATVYVSRGESEIGRIDADICERCGTGDVRFYPVQPVEYPTLIVNLTKEDAE